MYFYITLFIVAGKSLPCHSQVTRVLLSPDVGQGSYEATFNDPVWSLVLVDGSGPEEIFESRETIQAWVLDSLGE